MTKQICLTALGLLTLVGGSWLAAQTSDPTLIPQDNVPASTAGDVSQTRPAQLPLARRPSEATSGQRSTSRAGARLAQDSYRQDAQRYLEDARAFSEVRVAGQPIIFPGSQQRMNPEDAARMRAFQEAIRELRQSENDENREAARGLVSKLVSEQLDADLANREKELAAIEQRAKELRKQLEERKTAKPELLKMLVMLIDNPQVGLGIPPEWMQLLMRGQTDRNRQGQTIYAPFEIEPGAYPVNSSAFIPQPPTQPGAASTALPPVYAEPSTADVAPAEAPRRP